MTVEERISEMMRRIDTLTAENQALSAQVYTLVGEAQQRSADDAARAAGPELKRGLESLPAALAEVLARGGGAGAGSRAMRLVDGRGIDNK